MPKIRRRILALGIVVAIACSAFLFFTQRQLAAVEDLPKQLSDETFWKMISDFSEPGGYFRSDNFVSNDTTFQFVIPDLRRNTKPGGVYLGVGPDQNFTYIVALQPKIAFIVDIRHQNMLEHLIYKALIEQSADRADLLSLLFSRKRPAGVGASSTAEALFQAYEGVEPNPKLYEENLQKIKDTLEKKHGFKLSKEEEDGIEYVYRNFLIGGPDLTYNGAGNNGGGFNRGRMPTYEEVQKTDDGNGVNRAYMGSEENFKILQDLEKRNLIVPLTGDFGGPKAIRAVGQYLKDHGASVTAIYVSNVEQYLFQDDGWSKYYSNVATLPLDSTSTFIRSVFNMNGYAIPGSGYGTPGAMRSASVLCSVQDLVKAYKAGQITSYSDVIRMSRLPQKQ